MISGWLWLNGGTAEAMSKPDDVLTEGTRESWFEDMGVLEIPKT